MADNRKLSALPIASTIAGSDLFYLVQGGLSKRVTGTTFITFAAQTMQPAAANLSAVAGLEGIAGRVAYFTGAGSMATAPSTAFGRGLWNVSDAAAMKAGLAIAPGDLGGLGAGVASFLATPSSANLRTALADESGAGQLVFQGGNIGAATGASLALTGACSVTAPAGVFIANKTIAGGDAGMTIQVNGVDRWKVGEYNSSVSNTSDFRVQLAGVGLGLSISSTDFLMSIGGGLFIPNQALPPFNPNGGSLFVQGGALKFRGGSGTVTTLAPA